MKYSFAFNSYSNMTNNNTTLINWLKDAHAMEKSMIETLERHKKEAKDFSDMQEMIGQHLETTKAHAEKMELCLEDLGEDASSIKEIASGAMGAAQGVVNKIAKDHVVKNALMDYSAQNFAIASYEALIAGAEKLGHADVVNAGREILEGKKQMAEELKSRIPDLTVKYLAIEEVES